MPGFQYRVLFLQIKDDDALFWITRHLNQLLFGELVESVAATCNILDVKIQSVCLFYTS